MQTCNLPYEGECWGFMMYIDAADQMIATFKAKRQVVHDKKSPGYTMLHGQRNEFSEGLFEVLG
jgi:hypothetical protein